ncbi:RHS repeat-associated core domain-containing protein [Chryseobacterium sediminis]|nr:RHS repeat-associated core domain-containing protein [Chryseobacterium sediminis]
MKLYDKKIQLFSSFILSLCSVLGFSQTILYQAETTSRTVQDPQTVVLAPGFQAKASISNPFVAKIGPATENPGGGPTDSNAGANNPSGTIVADSIKFHDTKGNIEVNQAGQLQFTLPIALPPGIKNVAPQVNLMYTSGSGNGIAGYGWNISGITTISRIGKNIEQDGESKGIQLNYSDYYSFNGQRLILKSGEYGKDGAEYVTEKYSNIKIKSIGQNSGQTGPLYFDVTFEDGSQALYGLNADARTSIEYNINMWKDSQGNYISYNYIQGNGVTTIHNISWGGNENLNKPHFNTIEFTYINRSVREQSYINGVSLIQNNLLKEIKVTSNGSQFKRYKVEYTNNNTNYLFANKITEYNSNNEPANPIIFENEPDPAGIDSNLFRQDDRFDNIRGDNVLSGDFNGDGKLDFLNGKTLMLGRLDGTGNFVNVNYTGTALSIGTYADTNTPFSDQVLITGAINRNLKKSTIYFYKYANNTFINIATKDIDLTAYPQLFEAADPDELRCHFDGSTNRIDAKEVDFNGDGISELILMIKNEHMWTCQDYNSSYTWPETTGVDMNFYVDFKNNIFSPINDANFYVDYKNTINIDLDGDGKIELLHRLPGILTFLTFDIQNSKFEKIYPDIQAGNSGYNGSLPPIIGDYNGDGKTDILVPVAIDSSDWNMYISSGKGFVQQYYSNLFLYKPEDTGAGRKFRNTLRSYWAPDLNKDGKSDFLVFESQKWFRDCLTCVNNPDSSYGFNYFRNTGVDSTGKPTFTFNYNLNPKEATDAGNIEDEDINYSKYGEHYTPMFGSFRLSKLNTEFIILHKTKLITWNLEAKTDVISRIKSISQSGIKTQIDYSNLVNGNVYKSYYTTSPIFYPYANIIQNFNYYVVSAVTQGERKQEFRYRDLIGNLNGRGIIGFRQTARSTFFTDLFVNTKIWNGSEINPLNEGLPYKDWSIRTTDESKIFPDDISLNNYQLLSFKQCDYKIDKLLNGTVVTNTITPVNKPKIVTAINPYITVSKDFLRDIKTVNKVEEYDNLYFPKKSVKTINDGYAILTTQLEYYPANTTPGSNYSIGKPKSKTDTNQAYGDTKSTKEEYTYENNLLKTLKVWNRDNTGYLLDSYNYDGFGNITETIASNSLDSQTQTSSNKYDEKGRFVTKKTDNLGLQTNIIYNDWGLVTKQTDPLGNTLINEYDGWGKVLKSKTNLGGTTTNEYKKDQQYNSIVIQYDPDGNISKKYTNKWGQEYRTSTKAFEQGYYISMDTQYDVLGRKKAESEPYGEGLSPWQWNVIEYNDSFYPAKVKTTALATLNNWGGISSFSGKQMETFVSGTITTSTELNGYNRVTYKTTDALGNTTSTTDPGGSIVFSYNAASEQIKAQYAENIVTTKYDTWGRKSEFNDPSNGIYKYEYDGFGQPKKVTSPKGTKEYIYDNLGQLISQKEISTVDGGQATNKTISFVYDDKGRLTSKSGTSNGKTYSSTITYDPQGRILSSSESSNERYFIQKGITYDDKLRVTSYEKQLFSAGVLTKVQIENVYSAWNGDLYQIKDKNSGKVLWELKNLDAKGHVLKAQLGAAEINQTYEPDGTLSQVNHGSAAKPHILRLSYTFNPIKNELESRSTEGDFYIPESFDYDNNNRLINWSNPVTGTKTQNAILNTYDAKGRILENNQVGKIKFENSTKIYQPTGMTLNTAGEQNYNNDLIQTIAYNENNDPVFIDGMKGDVAFQYGLTAMRQRVTYGGNFNADGNGKFTKFYSEDGSFEVTKDNITGKEKHILYIGGSPYESSIIYVKNYNETSASYKFLHKDYLGSILAISDEAGNKLEQRHFDAWGNLTHLQIGNGQIITDVNKIQEIVNTGGLLLERGYTSHEHFMEVGIIHMNGRLYDPLLRRFLNADENIQDAYNTQSYNKYGYVMNNPLMFNDPNGEYALPAAMLVAFAAAIVTSITGDYIMNRPVNIGSLYQSVTLAAMTSYLTFGVGELFRAGGQIANSLSQTSLIIAKAGAHAITQGTLSYMQGGNFWSGALSGAFASASNDLLDLGVKKVGENNILRSDGFALFNGAVSGGVGSVLGGGNFWVGAGQGLMVTAFNFLAHKTFFHGIKFVDDDDNVIAKYATKKYNATIKVPYKSIGRALNLNEMYKALPDIDIVGIGIGGDFTFAMGGGKSIEFVFFLDGVNAGSWSTFTAERGNVGISGQYSVYGILGDYFDDANLKSSDYTGYSFSVSADVKNVKNVGASTFWSPKNYEADKSGFKSMFDLSKRSWSGVNVSVGLGGGFQWTRTHTNFYK